MNEIFREMEKDPLYRWINLPRQAEQFKKHRPAQGLPLSRDRFENWLGNLHEVKARKAKGV